MPGHDAADSSGVNSEESLERAAFAEADEATASPDVQQTFDEIRAVLRVPFVDQFWRVLAAKPNWLAAAWRLVAPALATVAAERASDELRREALIPLAIELSSHKAFRGDMSRAEIAAEDRERISNYTDAAQYVLPKLLLAAALLSGRTEAKGSTLQADAGELLPRGVAAGMPRVEPLPADASVGEAPALFAELRQRHGYAAVADYYRSVARAGDFLRIALNALRPVIGDPEYYAQSRALVDAARRLSHSLSEAVNQAGSAFADGEERRILAFYLNQLLPETLIEVTIIKGLMDGPHLAAYNRFSMTNHAPATPDFHDDPLKPMLGLGIDKP